jgi:proline iminopeptidase
MRMHRALPDAEIKVFPNSSHMPFFEEPDAFFPVLIDFLKRRGGRG